MKLMILLLLATPALADDPDLGSCCQSDGTCINEVPASQCEGLWEPRPCAEREEPCPPPVPTVPAWALLVLVLVLMFGGRYAYTKIR